ncbi:MAG TPA: ribosome-recycling factor, partial [Nitrospina sp.]|nr:ribosome-recycling factor [Nitrospina sp.]
KHVNDKMKKSEKNHEVSEDESHKGIDDIQKTTDKFVAEVDKISHAKEKDVMDV